MANLQNRKRNFKKCRRGAVLVYILFAIVMLFGMAAVAVDVAMIYGARRRAQSVADSAALATGPLLPNQTASTTAASGVTTANNITGPAFQTTDISFTSGPNASITLDDGTAFALAGGYAITITGYVNAPVNFGPIVGYNPTSKDGKPKTLSVSARASVIVRPACGIPGSMGMGPFGLVADDPNSNNPDIAFIARLLSTSLNSITPPPNTYQPIANRVPLKVGRWQQGTLGAGGNFGALGINGNGATPYKDSISTPTDKTFQIGDLIPTETGNMVGPTKSGVADRLDPANPAFTHRYADYVNWFFGDQSLPVDTSMPPVTDGNQTYYYRKDPRRQELTDARVMVIPLISQPSKNGQAEAQILAFAAFFIEALYTASGNNLVVEGRFIGIMFPSGGEGTCTGGGTYQWPRLVR